MERPCDAAHYQQLRCRSSDNPDGFILAGLAENGVSASTILVRDCNDYAFVQARQCSAGGLT